MLRIFMMRFTGTTSGARRLMITRTMLAAINTEETIFVIARAVAVVLGQIVYRLNLSPFCRHVSSVGEATI